MSGLSIATVLTSDRHRASNWDVTKSLEEAYQSLTYLNYNWEWLISYSDGNKPSGTWSTDSRVRCIPADTKSCIALNKLLVQARYPYWLDLDAASQLLDGVNDVIKQLENHPEVAYAYGHTIDFDNQSQAEIQVHSKHDFGLIEKGKITRYWLNTRGWWFVPISAFWKRDILLALGGYPALNYDPEISPLLKASLFYPVLSVDTFTYKYTKFPKVKEKDTYFSNTFIEEQLNLLLNL